MFPHYLFLTRFFWIFTLWNSFLLNSSYAQTTNMCFEFLNNSNEIYIDLPGRGNQISIDQFKKLSPSLQYRSFAFKDAIESLDTAEVIRALRNLNQPIDSYITPATIQPMPPELIEIIKSQNFAHAVEEHFYYFSSIIPELPMRTIVGLSLLFSKIKRPKHVAKTYIMTLNPYDLNAESKLKLFKKSIEAINQPRFISTLLQFIKNEVVQKISDDYYQRNTALVVEDFKTSLQLQSPHLPKTKIDEIIAERLKYTEKHRLNVSQIETKLSKNKALSDDELSQLMNVLVTFSDVLEGYYRFKFQPSYDINSRDFNNNRMLLLGELPRNDRLTFMEDFLIEYFEFRNGLDDLVGLLDHLNFGSSLPIKTEDLENSIVQSLKYFLMPVRNAITQINIQNRIQAESSNENPQILKPEWGYTPVSPVKNSNVPNPNKRKNSKERPSVQSLTTANVSTVSEIPDEINLNHFTSFSADPWQLSRLNADTVYQLRFMRNGNDSRIYTIQFERSVVEDLLEIPIVAQSLLRVLNLGFAKDTDEDGLIILNLKKSGQSGRYYELKVRKSNTRVILHRNGRHWRVLRVTDKLNLHRVLKGYL